MNRDLPLPPHPHPQTDSKLFSPKMMMEITPRTRMPMGRIYTMTSLPGPVVVALHTLNLHVVRVCQRIILTNMVTFPLLAKEL
jgi:hypothetical protein